MIAISDFAEADFRAPRNLHRDLEYSRVARLEARLEKPVAHGPSARKRATISARKKTLMSRGLRPPATSFFHRASVSRIQESSSR
jgi:hypothetical protein